jgi:A/G-specific adenine glycosylase
MPNATLATQVVRWQRRHGRNHLPWQNTQDPYRVWLSEIMLQQTQVITVLDYYARFLARFPDVCALAAAPLDEVLGLWSGLGYYSRARNLHRCAQAVAASGGQFPRTAQTLQALPGIGRSTASAIASLCYGERVAILDGNVKRVLARALAFSGDLGQAAAQRQLWALAETVLPTAAADMPRYTQGMMDLGATVCLARKPLCSACPITRHCLANLQSATEKYPVKTRKLQRSALSLWLLMAVQHNGQVWLQRRPERGIWASLFSLPAFDSHSAALACLPAALQAAAQELPAFVHVLTHKDLHLHPVWVVLADHEQPDAAGQWFTSQHWPDLGLPAPVRKLLVQHARITYA